MSAIEITSALLLNWAAGGVLVLAFLLSAAFLRGRAALAALVLLWAWAGLGIAAQMPPLAGLPMPRLEAILWLAPLDVLIIALVVETVVISRVGLLLLGLLVLQSALALWLPAGFWDAVWSLERLPSRHLGDLFQSLGLPAPGMSAFIGLLAAVIASVRWWRRRDPVLLGLAAAALVAGWLGYGMLTGTPSSLPLVLGGAGLLGGAGWASYKMAFLDALTGLPGRRILDERMARLGRTWSVAMVDVDHFKKFNDTHGHDVGDQVLKLVASRLRRHFGADAYRYGGEEFSILFTGRAADEALERCDAFRADIADNPMVIRAADRPAEAPMARRPSASNSGAARGKAGAARKSASKSATTKKVAPSKAAAGGRSEVTITVSVGVAERTAERRRPEVVLKAADVALYKAKEGGRNRVVAHE